MIKKIYTRDRTYAYLRKAPDNIREILNMPSFIKYEIKRRMMFEVRLKDNHLFYVVLGKTDKEYLIHINYNMSDYFTFYRVDPNKKKFYNNRPQGQKLTYEEMIDYLKDKSFCLGVEFKYY